MPNQKPTIRISLSENDFKELVSGHIIKKDGKYNDVEFFLQDIGFDQMKMLIQFAELEQLDK